MTLGADFQVDFRLGGAGLKRLTAGTFDHGIDVLGMDICFHKPPVKNLNYKLKDGIRHPLPFGGILKTPKLLISGSEIRKFGNFKAERHPGGVGRVHFEISEFPNLKSTISGFLNFPSCP